MENISKHREKLSLDFRGAYLINGFIRKTLNREEEEELDQWILASEENMKLFEDLTDERMMDDFLRWYSERHTEAALEKVKERIQFNKKPKVISFWRYAAAACIVSLIGFGIYQLFPRKNKPEVTAVIKQDIQPGSKLATLKLSTGKIIRLDNVKDSVINDQVQIKDGEVVYTNGGSEVAIHEISIPRKGYYKLVLPDGSKVWLNAESSIKYPSAFISGERRVVVTGETFFEVAKDLSKPFIVSVNDIEITALGTAFNINAYTDGTDLKATLIEGSVKVSNNIRQHLLKPNEQINIGNVWQVKIVETSSITAWINNKFKLKNNTIEEIMRMVERWYDAKVVYKDKIDFHFNGTIDRGLPVSELLKLLEETGHVHFTIDGNTITVRK